ncbi:hypothetical protein C0992_006014 [Termitomyces sp. T32_za158]|nr:hypothetical protein C0992_006014 [Termitomyces sp. T32_za158]
MPITRQAACQQRATIPLLGALPTTPPSIGSPWNNFRMPKEEQSPTSSKAETSAVLIPSLQSSLSESLASLESLLSEDELVTSHQHDPETQAPGAYCRSAVTAN